jgi:hypothetical protein
MFYEEKVVNGILCHRSLPAGLWVQFTPAELTEKIAELQSKVSTLEGEIEEMNERDFHDADEN